MPTRPRLTIVNTRADDDGHLRLNPWCLVPVADDEAKLYGYAEYHPVTGGRSWTATTELDHIAADEGTARTRSGRVHHLGRRFHLADLRREGEEAWIAFHLLIHAVTPAARMALAGVDAGPDREWVTCCKAARHLGVPPPRRDPADCRIFVDRHAEEYLRLREQWDDPW